VSVYFCSGLGDGLPCSYFHDTTGLTEAQRIERYKYYHVLMLTSILFQEFLRFCFTEWDSVILCTILVTVIKIALIWQHGNSVTMMILQTRGCGFDFHSFH